MNKDILKAVSWVVVIITGLLAGSFVAKVFLFGLGELMLMVVFMITLLVVIKQERRK